MFNINALMFAHLGGSGPHTTLQQFVSSESWLYGLNFSCPGRVTNVPFIYSYKHITLTITM